jgi:pimeloyl-ACP methyl ester carboxylesterase
MEKIYCISGIGADERIFSNLSVDGYEIHPIPWLPLNKRDSLPDYAHRISEQIPGENPIILGLSFGGMLAVEIGKFRPTKKIFLVSSAKTSSELPAISRVPKADFLIDLVPDGFFRNSSDLGVSMVGAENKQEREFLKVMMKESAPGFIKWALKAVVKWKNKICPDGIVHIHGAADKVIPPANVHPDYWIDRGTHIIVYNRAEEVSRVISDVLSNLPS